MITGNRATLAIILLCAFFVLPAIVAHSAGGRIEGKVVDPKGSAVVGATVTITDEVTNRIFTGVTDQQGRYKVEGVPAGSYTVVVSAKGFNEGRKEAVKVDEDQAAVVDLKVEIAAVEASVTVGATSLKANNDPVYQQLRQQARSEGDFTGPFATVSNFVLKREGATFTMRNGEVYFVKPVEGRYTGAVFFGDGEVSVIPPTRTEQNALKIFIDEPTLTEQVSSLVLRFTDKTFDEFSNSTSVKMSTGGPQSTRARDLFRENQTLMRKELRDNSELRVLADLYAPERPGFFTAFINGKRFSKLVYLYNPLGIPEVSPEEVLLYSYGTSDGGFWTAFHRLDEYRKGTATSSEDHRLIDMTRHEIDGTIKGTQISATDRVSFKALVPGTRVLLLNLYRTLRVSKVTDEQGTELSFVQEDKNEDADLGIILPKPLEAGKTYTLTVQYSGGDALRDSGGGNYILIPRLSWYPNNGGTQFGDRAIFDMTFRYPKGQTFVGTGAMVGAETREGDYTVAKWSSGSTELAVSGFNYGKFKKKEVADASTGYNIEFYANEQVPDELKEIQRDIERAESQGTETFTTLGVISTTKMADSAIADTQNSTRIYNAYFGKLPYTRIAMTQQPAGNFGQAWPTLVFMPYTAFLDTTQRTQLMGSQGGTSSFWRYVGPHEIAHQWWGHTIGWDSYHDQWMSEGFAQLSTSLYVQYVRKDLAKFVDFWEEQRRQIVEARPSTRNRKPYTVGPVTQGYRLNSAKTGNIAQNLIYPKGAYILHMIRMMMYNAQTQDALFQAMMKDFVKTHFNTDISTDDFQKAVEKHITPDMDVTKNGSMDWFFNEWVYGTEMPSYKFDYQINPDGTLSGTIAQSGVTDNFVMLVPIYVDFGKGWVKLGSASITGNKSLEITNLKLAQVPKRAAICVMNDVLAASISNSK
ncbi:MAG TPA: carboxypeptidase regulatory-like domain-containing protein [Pyrinomonadaceae bacterium]|nr:carboxypeptidase regulatory-like domain-containing protein [Pyrinomonadaceae bacterium]